MIGSGGVQFGCKVSGSGSGSGCGVQPGQSDTIGCDIGERRQRRLAGIIRPREAGSVPSPRARCQASAHIALASECCDHITHGATTGTFPFAGFDGGTGVFSDCPRLPYRSDIVVCRRLRFSPGSSGPDGIAGHWCQRAGRDTIFPFSADTDEPKADL